MKKDMASIIIVELCREIARQAEELEKCDELRTQKLIVEGEVFRLRSLVEEKERTIAALKFDQAGDMETFSRNDNRTPRQIALEFCRGYFGALNALEVSSDMLRQSAHTIQRDTRMAPVLAKQFVSDFLCRKLDSKGDYLDCGEQGRDPRDFIAELKEQGHPIVDDICHSCEEHRECPEHEGGNEE